MKTKLNRHFNYVEKINFVEYDEYQKISSYTVFFKHKM